ncbi:zinc ABC transporter substrate-binding protein [Aerococcaceae bacterium DSM 111021]|nr:zinc ABC transporter substrate-binding protein [Aerococcaceae bacterium DSM 111021]
MNKNIKSVFTFFSLLFILFISSTTLTQAQENKPKITVTTTFLVDIIEQIAPDTFDIESIVPAGGDPHIYTATAGNLKDITEAEIVLFHGLHFEAQLAQVLNSLSHTHSVTADFDSTQLISLSEDSEEVDPHYWFDLDLYKQSVKTTEAVILDTFPEYTDLITENTQSYVNELDELRKWIDTELDKLPVEDRILVTPHDAFAYFAHAHDFTVYAPQGISTESEVSNDSIISTVNFIIEHNVPAIFLDTTSNPQAMEKLQEGVKQQNSEVTVVGGEGQELYSDSLATTGQPNDNYIDMYRHNVSLIVENLVR